MIWVRAGARISVKSQVRLLGQGAFAEVYLGEHVHLNTQAAIKVLHTQLTSDGTEQFRKEARTIAHLEHPHIVRVLDFGIEQGFPFLVMTHAPNGSLRQRHPKGTQLPLQIIVSYIKQIADALQYAHDNKLIHRDVKPENMLLGGRNEILLSDFGIAVEAHSTLSQTLQEIAGTIPYMAPEQIQGKPCPASDQYALGIATYEWISGVRPFNGSTVEIAIQQQTTPPPSLHERVPGLSPTMEQVVLKALAKDPRQRFASIQEFADVLEQVSLSSQPVGVLLSSNTQMPTHLAPTLKISPSSVTVPALGTTLVTYRGHADYIHALSWSPDGSRIASGGADTTVQIWDAVTGSTLFAYRGHIDKILSVAWSPDGMRIASAGNDKTVQVRIWNEETKKSFFSRQPRNVGIYRNHPDIVSAVAWSPDGVYIASAGYYSQILPRTNLPRAKKWRSSVQKESPKDFRASLHKNGESKTVQIWDAATGQKIRYCNGHLLNGRGFGIYGAFPDIRHEDEYYDEYYPFKVHAVAWSPDGTRIASGGEDGTIQIWDVATARLIFLYDEHQDSEKGSYDKDPRNVFSVAWSPNGKQIASADEDGEIHVWDVATGQRITACKHPSQVNAVAWSPDGLRIASGSEYGGVQIWNVSTGDEIFTYRGHVGSVPVNAVAWSPDGARIASASYDVQVWQAT